MYSSEPVRGRNPDNTPCRKLLGWAPGITLAHGVTPTYEWINRQVHPAA